MIKAGIFFGGPSREREISFAGGRTVYDNLDKSLFQPVPIFVDSRRQLILLDWPYLYKGTIRDFYPPVEALPPSPNGFQIYLESLGPLSDEARDALIARVGRRVNLEELPQLIDVAFLALHGEYGEDGQLQGLLESLQIPYTGSGIRACSIGIDKAFQKKIMEAGGFASPEVRVLSRAEWIGGDAAALYGELSVQLGFPIVIRPANQGSSIGVSILPESAGLAGFEKAVNRALFREELEGAQWRSYSRAEKVNYLRELTDIRDGLGFPLQIGAKTLYHPEELFTWLEAHFSDAQVPGIVLESHLSEQEIILESFIQGKEFSCIVIRTEDGRAAALPPTEIIKAGQVFDYRSKYTAGFATHVLPADIPPAVYDLAMESALTAHRTLGCSGVSRCDFRFDERYGTTGLHLLEINTQPGMTGISLVPEQAAHCGISFGDLVVWLVEEARCHA